MSERSEWPFFHAVTLDFIIFSRSSPPSNQGWMKWRFSSFFCVGSSLKVRYIFCSMWRVVSNLGSADAFHFIGWTQNDPGWATLFPTMMRKQVCRVKPVTNRKMPHASSSLSAKIFALDISNWNSQLAPFFKQVILIPRPVERTRTGHTKKSFVLWSKLLAIRVIFISHVESRAESQKP